MTSTAAHSQPLSDTTTAAPPAWRPGPVARLTLAVARICLGWIFLWAFVDKMFGLGYGTPASGAWIHGASPTAGYLGGVRGSFAHLFSSMSGQAWADWLYMVGMGGLGVAFVLGIGMRVASIGGIALLGMLWLSSLPLDTNPFMDQHLVYLVTAFALTACRAGDTLGLGKWWAGTGLVRALPFLR
ncbi:MAG TPA: hypothetical protein VE172_23430 [Stackebrandtia sp.]|jgi:thiosulfate dehydrogenase [quinone] large subunit|uniref:hypothetical protein n=1 Tax=Stackebrandtia sp. TaxID=2023065 RepID=UPI002D25DD2B|nr:hypothetical protein [Stackebrandtia sp.]HZE41762.1 hypothetical protein [Stackebrandtia sp.]